MAEGDYLDAPITAVTVLTSGARVTRTGRVNLEPGLRPILIARLPDSADPSSVRVAVRGGALLDVDVRQRYTADPLREETAVLRAEVERLTDQVRELTDADAAQEARLTFLGHLAESAPRELARAISFGRAATDVMARMSGYLADDTASALDRRREIAARKRVAERELDAAKRRLAQAKQRADHTVTFAEVGATIEAGAAVRAEIELSYHVSGASWQPLYDLTLTGDRLSIGYLAEVTQQTGEDWPEIPLVLSTARQGAHGTLPELRPWYIGRERPVVFHSPRVRTMAARAPAPGGAAAAGAAEMEDMMPLGAAQDLQAAVVTGESGENGAGISYQVQRPLAVPADGAPHKTTVARLDADARLDHLVVPVLAAEAYLRATITNSSPLLLLPGRARIFHEGQFAGETALETVAPGEEFELQLGVDDQIRVERKLARRSTSKAVIGGKRTIDIAYEITIENHRAGQARVSVHDHVPLSSDAEIKVAPRETSPAPAKHDDLGELTWDLVLDPGKSALVRYRFTVEHPAQVTVIGL